MRCLTGQIMAKCFPSFSGHSLSKHGLETPLKSLFYLFVRVYAVLYTVNEQIVQYFSMMNESFNSNVSVQSFNHDI
jgi:hypothetical protein